MAGSQRRGRESVAAGGRFPGLGRSSSVAEISGHEITSKVTTDFEWRVKLLLKYIKESDDAELEPNDPSIETGLLKDVLFPNFLHFMSTRKKVKEPGKGQPVTKGDLEKYKHAMVWFTVNESDQQAADIWPDFHANCSRFFKAYQRKIAKMKEKGEISSEEGSPSMPRAVYRWLCEKAMEQGNHFAHLFLCLEWNLICRSVTTTSVNLKDMETFEDCLTFAFHRFKGKQEGTDEMGKDKKHCCSNPLEGNEPIDLLMALAIYLSTYDDEYGHMKSNKLFPMEDPSSAFSKWLAKQLGTVEVSRLREIKSELQREDLSDEARGALVEEQATLREHEGIQIQQKCVCALHFHAAYLFAQRSVLVYSILL